MEEENFSFKIYNCSKWHNFLKIFFLNFITTIVQIYYVYNQKNFGIPDGVVKLNIHGVNSEDIPNINWIIFIIGGVSLFIHSLLMWLLSIIAYFIDYRLMTKISYMFLVSNIFWQIVGTGVNYGINHVISIDISSFGCGSMIGLVIIMIFLICALCILSYRRCRNHHQTNVEDDFYFR